MNKVQNSVQNALRVAGVTLMLACAPAVMCHASDEPDLTSAVRQKDVTRVRLLLSEGSGVNERDEGAQQTPLMRAAQMGDVTITQTLLAHGADVNAQDDFGHTALMFASEKGNAALVNALLKAGAKSGLRDRAGETALTFARQGRYTAIVRRLTVAQRNTLAAMPTIPSGARDIATR